MICSGARIVCIDSSCSAASCDTDSEAELLVWILKSHFAVLWYSIWQIPCLPIAQGCHFAFSFKRSAPKFLVQMQRSSTWPELVPKSHFFLNPDGLDYLVSCHLWKNCRDCEICKWRKGRSSWVYRCVNCHRRITWWMLVQIGIDFGTTYSGIGWLHTALDKDSVRSHSYSRLLMHLWEHFTK